jgi:hypothetical protein
MLNTGRAAGSLQHSDSAEAFVLGHAPAAHPVSRKHPLSRAARAARVFLRRRSAIKHCAAAQPGAGSAGRCFLPASGSHDGTGPGVSSAGVFSCAQTNAPAISGRGYGLCCKGSTVAPADAVPIPELVNGRTRFGVQPQPLLESQRGAKCRCRSAFASQPQHAHDAHSNFGRQAACSDLSSARVANPCRIKTRSATFLSSIPRARRQLSSAAASLLVSNRGTRTSRFSSSVSDIPNTLCASVGSFKGLDMCMMCIQYVYQAHHVPHTEECQ